MARSPYTPAERAEMMAVARKMLRAGATRKDAAATLGCDQGALSRWLREQTLERQYPTPNRPHATSFDLLAR